MEFQRFARGVSLASFLPPEIKDFLRDEGDETPFSDQMIESLREKEETLRSSRRASSSALSVHSVHSVRSQSSRTSRHSKQRRATTDVVDVDATHEAKEETWEVDEAAIETARTDVFREVAKGKNELDEEETQEYFVSIGLEASDVKQM